MAGSCRPPVHARPSGRVGSCSAMASVAGAPEAAGWCSAGRIAMPSLAPTRARTVATSSASNDTTGKKPCRDPQPGLMCRNSETADSATSGSAATSASRIRSLAASGWSGGDGQFQPLARTRLPDQLICTAQLMIVARAVVAERNRNAGSPSSLSPSICLRRLDGLSGCLPADSPVMALAGRSVCDRRPGVPWSAGDAPDWLRPGQSVRHRVACRPGRFFGWRWGAARGRTAGNNICRKINNRCRGLFRPFGRSAGQLQLK